MDSSIQDGSSGGIYSVVFYDPFAGRLPDSSTPTPDLTPSNGSHTHAPMITRHIRHHGKSKKVDRVDRVIKDIAQLAARRTTEPEQATGPTDV